MPGMHHRREMSVIRRSMRGHRRLENGRSRAGVHVDGVTGNTLFSPTMCCNVCIRTDRRSRIRRCCASRLSHTAVETAMFTTDTPRRVIARMHHETRIQGSGKYDHQPDQRKRGLPESAAFFSKPPCRVTSRLLNHGCTASTTVAGQRQLFWPVEGAVFQRF